MDRIDEFRMYGWGLVAAAYSALNTAERLETLDIIKRTEGPARLREIRTSIGEMTGRNIPPSTIENYLRGFEAAGLVEHEGLGYTITGFGDLYLALSYQVANHAVNFQKHEALERIREYASKNTDFRNDALKLLQELAGET